MNIHLWFQNQVEIYANRKVANFTNILFQIILAFSNDEYVYFALWWASKTPLSWVPHYLCNGK